MYDLQYFDLQLYMHVALRFHAGIRQITFAFVKTILLIEVIILSVHKPEIKHARMSINGNDKL